MMASDVTTPRVIANNLLHSSGNSTVTSFDALGTHVNANASTFPTLLTAVCSLLSTPPTEEEVFGPEQLQTLSAGFITLSESFRLARNRILLHEKNKKALMGSWPTFRRWILKFFDLTLSKSAAELENYFTPAGEHGIWDLIGWVCLVVYEFALNRDFVHDLQKPDFRSAHIHMWVKVRSSYSPRILVEDRVGDVLDLITPNGLRGQVDYLFQQTVESFPEEFVLKCYHRVIARVAGPSFGTAGHDNWSTCFRFVQFITACSPPFCFLFLANKSLYWMVHGFRKQLSRHATDNGREAYVKFYPSLMHAVLASFSDSHAWIPQAIKAHLVHLMLRSSPHLDAICAEDPGVPQRMKEIYFHLSTNLIHPEVLRCTMKSVPFLRKRGGEIEPILIFRPSSGVIRESWIKFMHHLDEMESFWKTLKAAGGHFSSCSYSECTGDDIGTHQCRRCLRAFYCSRICQKADWGEHREDCRRDTTAERKGNVLPVDERARAFIKAHVSHLLRTKEFSRMLHAFMMSKEGTRLGMIVVDVDYTKSPPALAINTLFDPKYFKHEDFDDVFTHAAENPDEGLQVAHISLPFVNKEPEHLLTIFTPSYSFT